MPQRRVPVGTRNQEGSGEMLLHPPPPSGERNGNYIPQMTLSRRLGTPLGHASEPTDATSEGGRRCFLAGPLLVPHHHFCCTERVDLSRISTVILKPSLLSFWVSGESQGKTPRPEIVVLERSLE